MKYSQTVMYRWISQLTNPRQMNCVNTKATPQATPELTTKLLKLIHDAGSYKQLKKGVNESIKSLNRGTAELVIIAGDTEPFQNVMTLPLICEDKNVPYIFIHSKAALGRACGLDGAVCACSITMKDGSQLEGLITQRKLECEKCLL